jgi:hypothetical protein
MDCRIQAIGIQLLEFGRAVFKGRIGRVDLRRHQTRLVSGMSPCLGMNLTWARIGSQGHFAELLLGRSVSAAGGLLYHRAVRSRGASHDSP